MFSESIEPGIKKKFLDGQYAPDVKEVFDEYLSEKIYTKYLKKYSRSLARQVVLKMLS